jgi:hypothetical protein
MTSAEWDPTWDTEPLLDDLEPLDIPDGDKYPVEEPSRAPDPSQHSTSESEGQTSGGRDARPGWPGPLDDDALYGVSGNIVRAIAPHTESDPMALLIQLLVFFGNVIGHVPHFMVEATRHALNLFVVLVGRTAKGRKGTAYDHIRTFFSTITPDWASACIAGGLSSGEGLIWAVRDASGKDLGVPDKRLLVTESEFAAPLRMLTRDGNVLSPTMRQAWDHGDLRIMTKNSPAVATGAHISLIGHITLDELRRELDSNSAGNGYGNRHLWVCVQRSQLLPEGGQLDDTILTPLIKELGDVMEYASSVGELRRDEQARERWAAIYKDLSEEAPGLVGSLTARAEPQVMRLACLFALLDKTDVVGVVHLDAALAIWKYTEGSVRFIFGDALGRPLADRLLRHLRAQTKGLSRTQIRDHLGRHGRQSEIDEALAMLSTRGRARSERIETRGKPAEVWHAITPESDAPGAVR